jgi:predicted nucleic acid-binding protein
MPDLPRGLGHVCFDASPLIHFADAGELAWLGTWFQPRAFTAEVVTAIELPKGKGKYAGVDEILVLPWLQSVQVEREEDVRFVARLLALWGSDPGRDHGEAEVVAICRRHGWTAIMDDRRGRDAATRERVGWATTSTMIVAAAAATHASVDELWDVYKRVLGRLERPAIPTTDNYLSAFKKAVRGIQRIINASDDDPWPNVLANPQLEKLVTCATAQRRVELGE